MRRRTSRRWWPWAVGSLVLIVLGVTLLVMGARGQDVGPGIPGPIGSTGVTPTTATTQSLRSPAASVRLVSMSWPISSTSPATQGQVAVTRAAHATRVPTHRPPRGPAFLARSRPVHLWIPALNVSASVIVLGLNSDGSVQVPPNTVETGWYKYGPAPGQRGSSVILGHVDSYRGIGVFFYLRNLRPGNLVRVELADRKIVNFSVIGLREYTKGQFPEKVVYGYRSYAGLQLVTCGGVFDHATGHYLSNIVVYTKRVMT